MARTKATCRKIRDSRLKEQKKAIKNSTALSLFLLRLVKCCMQERGACRRCERRHSRIMRLCCLYVMFSAWHFPISIFAAPPTLHRHTRSSVFMRWNVSCIGKESARKRRREWRLNAPCQLTLRVAEFPLCDLFAGTHTPPFCLFHTRARLGIIFIVCVRHFCLFISLSLSCCATQRMMMEAVIELEQARARPRYKNFKSHNLNALLLFMKGLTGADGEKRKVFEANCPRDKWLCLWCPVGVFYSQESKNCLDQLMIQGVWEL